MLLFLEAYVEAGNRVAEDIRILARLPDRGVVSSLLNHLDFELKLLGHFLFVEAHLCSPYRQRGGWLFALCRIPRRLCDSFPARTRTLSTSVSVQRHNFALLMRSSAPAEPCRADSPR